MNNENKIEVKNNNTDFAIDKKILKDLCVKIENIRFLTDESKVFSHYLIKIIKEFVK